jgi:LuxR family maltose regulon positive regulatory protein
VEETLKQQPGRSGSTAVGSALSPLRAAKLRRPTPGDHYVRRPRLLELLDEASRATLTLIVAPAGTGKTSLLAGWITESPIASAWLSLDEADRDAVQCWSGIIAALDTLEPGCGSAASEVLRRPGSHIDDVVDLLLADLDTGERAPAVLVIDDFHIVDEDNVVAASVAVFLRDAPSWLHVVIATRRRPRLPIDRMRSRGRLSEIRFAELRFATAEATELLTKLAPSLSDDRLKAEVGRAQGWAASLQMAALAARSAQARPDPSDVDRAGDLLVEDLVLREVLAEEGQEMIDLLAAVAVVPRVNSSLAEALTQQPGAGELLRHAEERGLFVTRLGPEGWFELHDLVREVLIGARSRTSASQVAELRVRAAQWFEAAGEVDLALEQWLQAGRPLEALRLLGANHAHLYDRGREATVVRTIAAIPGDATTGDPYLMIDYAFCHLLVDRRRFLELVDELTWFVDHTSVDETVRVRVTILRGSAAVLSGRWVDYGVLSREAMHDLGGEWRSDPLGRFVWNGIGRSIALAECWDDANDEVRRAEIELSRDPERRLALEGSRALGEALAGRPIDALRVAAGVHHAAAVAKMSILRTELAFAEALAHRELGDRARAVLELEALIGEHGETMLYCRILAMIELAQTHLDGGNLGAASDTFRETKRIVEEESFGHDLRLWLARVGTLLALADGDLVGARQWADQNDDEFWGGISRARVHLAAGNRTDAAAELATSVPRCVRHRVIDALLRARSTVDREDAASLATAAVELAADNGLLQTVASEGPQVLELVERVAAAAPPEWLDRLRRAAADAQLRAGSDRTDLIEPLTERERDVLRFLPSRLTVREIADELYVSVNTLKFHLKVIYRKLGVTSRAEAAEAARKMMSLRR